jgi:hypothetical protein
LVTVTLAPGATVREFGEKAKLWMMIESAFVLPPEAVLVGAPLGVPEVHAARTSVIPSRKMAATRLTRADFAGEWL